jgi:hypothetical protein
LVDVLALPLELRAQLLPLSSGVVERAAGRREALDRATKLGRLLRVTRFGGVQRPTHGGKLVVFLGRAQLCGAQLGGGALGASDGLVVLARRHAARSCQQKRQSSNE